MQIENWSWPFDRIWLCCTKHGTYVQRSFHIQPKHSAKTWIFEHLPLCCNLRRACYFHVTSTSLINRSFSSRRSLSVSACSWYLVFLEPHGILFSCSLGKCRVKLHQSYVNQDDPRITKRCMAWLEFDDHQTCSCNSALGAHTSRLRPPRDDVCFGFHAFSCNLSNVFDVNSYPNPPT